MFYALTSVPFFNFLLGKICESVRVFLFSKENGALSDKEKTRLIALYTLFGLVVTMFIPAIVFMFLEVGEWYLLIITITADCLEKNIYRRNLLRSNIFDDSWIWWHNPIIQRTLTIFKTHQIDRLHIEFEFTEDEKSSNFIKESMILDSPFFVIYRFVVLIWIFFGLAYIGGLAPLINELFNNYVYSDIYLNMRQRLIEKVYKWPCKL